MNATKSLNTTNTTPSNSHSDHNFNISSNTVAGTAAAVAMAAALNRISIVAATTCPGNSSSTFLIQTSAPTSSQRSLEKKEEKESAWYRECSRATATNVTTLAAKEIDAVAYEDTTKLMPTAAIKLIIINKNDNSNINNNNMECDSSQQRINSSRKNESISNKSTSQSSTATSDAKLDSSKFINSSNKLTTITHARQQQQNEQTKQTEQMSSTARGLNQINLKPSLYAVEQQLSNDNNNYNNSNDNNSGKDIQNMLSINVKSNSYTSSNQNNANHNNKKKATIKQKEVKREKCESATINNNNNDSNQVCDSERINNKHAQVNQHNNESNELPQLPQQLITATVAAVNASIQTSKITTATEITAAVAATATKVGAENIATKTTMSINEKVKTATLTLRKSLSTPASFKVGDVAEQSNKSQSQSKSKSSLVGNNNKNTNRNADSNNIKLIISASKVQADEVTQRITEDAVVVGNADTTDAGGGGKCAKPTTAITKAQFKNTSIEATTTKTKTTPCTTLATTKAAATMDVVMRSQYIAANAVQQQQQSNAKWVKAKDNDNQVICSNCNFSVGGDGGGGDDNDVCVVASTTTTMTTTTASSSLSLRPLTFDLDLRFGCAHYKRCAMFVTPCCNKFYKCRFCHDENESHHFDRKTLTELICSECNTRQKVQEQCEACGTRFGKYTCLICNLFDDTDKKQYHCNGCGICRIGGAENFFHCEVCDMCLPIRLKIDGHRCVENISRSHCPVCLGDIHTSRIPCHIPDCGHLLHKTCFDQLLNSGHYTCPICQTSLIDMTALWEYLDAQAVSLPVPKKYENQRIHIFCNDCHKTSKTKFNFIGLKCMQCGAYNTTQDVKRRMSLVADEPSSA